MKYSIRKVGWSVLLLLLLLPYTVFATSALPSPKESFYVNDFAKVINKSDEAIMIANGNALDNLNGAQIVLVTIDFVGERSLSDFAADLFNQWGIGDAKKNNGLLIVMSIGDDDYWAVQGRGLEATLTSGIIADILDNHLEADFAEKSYSAGAKQVYSAFVQQLGGTWENSVTSTSTKKEQATAPIVSTKSTVASVDTKKNTETSGYSNWMLNLLSILVVWYFISKLFGRSRRNRTYRTHDHHSTVYYHTDESYRNDGGWFSGSSGSSGSSRRNNTSRSVSGGGGSTRGGGAGRSTSSSSSSSFGSAGGGSTRGGGAGRSTSNSSGAGRSSASSRSTGSAGGGSTRGGGAGRRR